MKISIFIFAIFIAAYQAAAEDVPPKFYDMAAAVRVLAFFNPTFRKGATDAIDVVSNELAVIRSAKIVFVHVPGTRCTYQKRDFGNEPVEIFQINFEKVYSEYSASNSGIEIYAASGGICTAFLRGTQAARVSVNLSAARCQSAIASTSYGGAVPAVIRAINYIDGNICSLLRPPPY